MAELRERPDFDTLDMPALMNALNCRGPSTSKCCMSTATGAVVMTWRISARQSTLPRPDPFLKGGA